MTSGRSGMTYGLTTMTAKDVCCGGRLTWPEIAGQLQIQFDQQEIVEIYWPSREPSIGNHGSRGRARLNSSSSTRMVGETLQAMGRVVSSHGKRLLKTMTPSEQLTRTMSNSGARGRRYLGARRKKWLVDIGPDRLNSGWPRRSPPLSSSRCRRWPRPSGSCRSVPYATPNPTAARCLLFQRTPRA